MEKSDLLWSLYLSEREFIKHHENQRTNASNILGAIAAGLIVALGTDKLVQEVQLIIAVLLMILGIFGYTFCAKLYALMKLHAERSYQYLAVLDEEVAAVQIAGLKKVADKKYKERFSFFSKIQLNKIWGSLHLSIFLVGVIFFALNIFKIVS